MLDHQYASVFLCSFVRVPVRTLVLGALARRYLCILWRGDCLLQEQK